MTDRWVVFGGWAMAPDLLRPLFGNDSIYVDVNDFMPALVENGKLRTEWIDIVRTKTGFTRTQPDYGLAGWSTGAIIACGLALAVPVKNLVLLSATPSFCKRGGFRHGQRPGVLDVMRRELLKPGNTVAGDFGVRCGISGAALINVLYEPRNLIEGLHFLEQVDLLPRLKKLTVHARVFHGDNDPIIPSEAGKMLADLIGAEFSLLAGGHAFFIGQTAELKKRF